MNRMSRLLVTIAAVFAIAFGAGLMMPETAEATHCYSDYSCGCLGNPYRLYEKVICDGKVVSTKCYNYAC